MTPPRSTTVAADLLDATAAGSETARVQAAAEKRSPARRTRRMNARALILVLVPRTARGVEQREADRKSRAGRSDSRCTFLTTRARAETARVVWKPYRRMWR
jgi:hypothetical protein